MAGQVISLEQMGRRCVALVAYPFGMLVYYQAVAGVSVGMKLIAG